MDAAGGGGASERTRTPAATAGAVTADADVGVADGRLRGVCTMLAGVLLAGNDAGNDASNDGVLWAHDMTGDACVDERNGDTAHASNIAMLVNGFMLGVCGRKRQSRCWVL